MIWQVRGRMLTELAREELARRSRYTTILERVAGRPVSAATCLAAGRNPIFGNFPDIKFNLSHIEG